MSEAIFAAARDALEQGEPVALVTIVRTQGSTPQRVGAKMLVYADGRTIGTIGGGCYEHDALGKAREALAGGPPRLVSYELADDLAEDTGLICGGRMEVFIEPLEASPHLYLIGAGHVSRDLARAAHETGFRVTVVDDRQKFASAERFPDAEIVVDAIPDWLHRTAIPASAFVVILTRGHRHDLEALRALAARDLRYLGLIGSRAKVTRLFDALKAEGLPPECLRRVFAPVGLDIGAVTPAEIAVSILAEMIALRRGRLTADAAEGNGTARSMRHTPRTLAPRGSGPAGL
jgi:xanthine dehydrogenase accessory factor